MTSARRKTARGRKATKKKGHGKAATPPAPPAAEVSAPAAAPAVEPPAPVETATPASAPPSWLVVDRVKLAQILGINDNTISDWLKHGMPALERGGRGKPAKYDAIACLNWYRDNKVGRNAKDIAQTRLFEANAKRSELAFALASGEVWKREDIIREGLAFVKAWSAMVRSISRQARRSGIITTDLQESQLAGLCRRILDEAARWQVPKDLTRSEESYDDPAA